MVEKNIQKTEKIFLPKEREKEAVLANILRNKLQLLNKAGIPIQSDPQTLITQTLRMVEFFDIHEDFFLSYFGKIRPYILLGLVDLWLQTTNLDEKKGLFDLVKILCSEEWKSIDQRKHLGNRVIKQAAEGKRFGYEFVSGNKANTSKAWQDRETFADEHFDQANSKELAQEIAPDNKNSFLRHIRFKLDISGPENPFAVKVLSYSANKMEKRFNGGIAFFIKGTLILPADYSDHLVEHEYIHSQQKGFNFGSHDILGRGLMEAWTEEQTRNPRYYEPQRKVLTYIQQTIPAFFDKLRQFSKKPDIANLDSIYLTVLSGFGLKGLISAIRLEENNTCTAEDSEYYHGKHIFLKPAQVKTNLITSRIFNPSSVVLQTLEDTDVYLADDLSILRWQKNNESDTEKKATIDRVIHQVKFQQAMSKARRESFPQQHTQLIKALSIYTNHLREEFLFCKDLITALAQKSTTNIDELVTIILEFFESQDKDELYALVKNFENDIQNFKSYFPDPAKEWSMAVALAKKLEEKAFLKHPHDYKLGYERLRALLSDMADEAPSKQINEFLALWGQVKKNIAQLFSQSVELDGTILTKTPNLLSAFLQENADKLTSNQIIILVDDIRWLINIVKSIPETQLSESEKAYVDFFVPRINQHIEKILSSLNTHADQT